MSVDGRRTEAFVGLGSNRGSRPVMLHAAVASLISSTQVDLDPVRDVAAVYETSPVGLPARTRPFLNSAVRLRTSLEADGLLRLLLDIERSLGRDRRKPYPTRPIDLDLILFGNSVIDRPGLTVPHPRFPHRRFVLEPLAGLAPDVCHPVLNATISDLARNAAEQYAADSVRLVTPVGWWCQGLFNRDPGHRMVG